MADEDLNSSSEYDPSERPEKGINSENEDDDDEDDEDEDDDDGQVDASGYESMAEMHEQLNALAKQNGIHTLTSHSTSSENTHLLRHVSPRNLEQLDESEAASMFNAMQSELARLEKQHSYSVPTRGSVGGSGGSGYVGTNSREETTPYTITGSNKENNVEIASNGSTNTNVNTNINTSTGIGGNENSGATAAGGGGGGGGIVSPTYDRMVSTSSMLISPMNSVAMEISNEPNINGNNGSGSGGGGGVVTDMNSSISSPTSVVVNQVTPHSDNHPTVNADGINTAGNNNNNNNNNGNNNNKNNNNNNNNNINTNPIVTNTNTNNNQANAAQVTVPVTMKFDPTVFTVQQVLSQLEILENNDLKSDRKELWVQIKSMVEGAMEDRKSEDSNSVTNSTTTTATTNSSKKEEMIQPTNNQELLQSLHSMARENRNELRVIREELGQQRKHNEKLRTRLKKKSAKVERLKQENNTMSDMIEKHIGAEVKDPNQMSPSYSELVSVHHAIRNRRAQSVASNESDDDSVINSPIQNKNNQSWFSWWTSSSSSNNKNSYNPNPSSTGYCRCARNDTSY